MGHNRRYSLLIPCVFRLMVWPIPYGPYGMGVKEGIDTLWDYATIFFYVPFWRLFLGLIRLIATQTNYSTRKLYTSLSIQACRELYVFIVTERGLNSCVKVKEIYLHDFKSPSWSNMCEIITSVSNKQIWKLEFFEFLLFERKRHKHRTSMNCLVRALWDECVSVPDKCRLLDIPGRRTKN